MLLYVLVALSLLFFVACFCGVIRFLGATASCSQDLDMKFFETADGSWNLKSADSYSSKTVKCVFFMLYKNPAMSEAFKKFDSFFSATAFQPSWSGQ